MLGVRQPWHLIVVMVFGPGKLPELGRAVGDGLRELKRASGDGPAIPDSLSPLAAAVPNATCPACRADVPTGFEFCGTCGAAQVRSRAA